MKVALVSEWTRQKRARRDENCFTWLLTRVSNIALVCCCCPFCRYQAGDLIFTITQISMCQTCTCQSWVRFTPMDGINISFYWRQALDGVILLQSIDVLDGGVTDRGEEGMMIFGIWEIGKLRIYPCLHTLKVAQICLLIGEPEDLRASMVSPSSAH